MMISWIPALVLAALPATVVRVDAHVEVAGANGALVALGTETTWIAPGHVRIDDANGSTIYDGVRGIVARIGRDGRVVQHRHEAVAGQVPPTAIVGVGLGADGAAQVPEHLFEARGAATVGRWNALEFSVNARNAFGETATVAIANDAGVTWSDLQDVVRAVYDEPGSKYDSFFHQVAALRGYPVRIVRTAKDHVVRSTVISIERVPAEESLFDIPEARR